MNTIQTKQLLTILSLLTIASTSLCQTDSQRKEAFATFNNVPIGTITAYAGSVESFDAYLKGRFMICDGTSISSKDYPLLYAVIGTLWGDTGTPNFKLPDLRGRFIRGSDLSAGNDPEAADRRDLGGGNILGDRVGSYQDDAFETHSIKYVLPQGPGLVAQCGNCAGVYHTGATEMTVEIKGGKETRPKNASLLYIIRVK